jgi:hypothetical protein
MIHWNDPAVQSSLINAVGSIVTGTIAALSAALIGRHFSRVKNLKEKLATAQDDIAFLLKVEEKHCATNHERDGASHKLRVRQAVREETGMVFSGKSTPGRVAYNNGPGRKFARD